MKFLLLVSKKAELAFNFLRVAATASRSRC